jgi:hypothetical protein
MGSAIPLFHYSTIPLSIYLCISPFLIPSLITMHLVQLLLPLKAPDGKPFPRSQYRRIRDVLTDRFGGLTAYTRAPAEGLWDVGDQVAFDDIVIYEVMVEELDRAWWAEYRAGLEREFDQHELVVRAQAIERL